MARLIRRKLLLIVLLLPLLNAAGFYYGIIYRQLLRQSHSYSQLAIYGGSGSHAVTNYSVYIRRVLTGDFGSVGGVPVGQILGEALRNSFILLIAALIVTLIFGPLLGFLSLSRHTRRVRPLVLTMLTAGASLPGFFLGTTAIAVIIFASMQIYGPGTIWPIGGFGLDKRLVLPVLTLASRPVLYVARITAGLLEHELQQDYIRVALGKGLSWRVLLWRHAFPNIAAPIAVATGQSMRLLASGLIVVEALFRWPGLGRIFMIVIGVRVDGRVPIGFFSRPDFLAAIAVIFGIWMLLADAIASLLSSWLDPRLRVAPRKQVSA